MTGMDKLIAGEGMFNHFWSLCFADEKLRNRLGLKYISQMRDKNPYWYLWFNDMPGVFRLNMPFCQEEAPWDWKALLRIKYYPHPQEGVFLGLSLLEQICRMSTIFDTSPAHWHEGETGCVCHGGMRHQGRRFAELQGGTGVPNLSRAAEVPEDFFLAGQMEVSYRAGLESQITWDSQDRLQVQMTENYYIPDQDGASLKVLRRGDIVRDFSGWLLTDFIARRFASGWQEIHGYQVVSEEGREEDGLFFTSDGRSLNPVLSPEVRRMSVCCRMQQ